MCAKIWDQSVLESEKWLQDEIDSCCSMPGIFLINIVPLSCLHCRYFANLINCSCVTWTDVTLLKLNFLAAILMWKNSINSIKCIVLHVNWINWSVSIPTVRVDLIQLFQFLIAKFKILIFSLVFEIVFRHIEFW